jgi:hypothetical protein|tara:strand:- start:13 stop:630 length:618 start_codon:yes stop_codon:yes gene_type:complete
MANINAAFGLRPYERSGSNYNNQGVNAYPINIEGMSDGTTSKIWTGSAVIPLGSGLIDIVGAAAGGTVPLLGVFMGCKYTALDGTPAWSAHFPGYAAIKAQTEATAFIADNPDALFVINADGALPDADRFSNMNFATMITGNDTSGYSLGELDVSTTAVTATLNTKVIAFDDQASTASGSVDKTVAGRLAVVRLNVHFMDSLLGI